MFVQISIKRTILVKSSFFIDFLVFRAFVGAYEIAYFPKPGGLLDEQTLLLISIMDANVCTNIYKKDNTSKK